MTARRSASVTGKASASSAIGVAARRHARDQRLLDRKAVQVSPYE